MNDEVEPFEPGLPPSPEDDERTATAVEALLDDLRAAFVVAPHEDVAVRHLELITGEAGRACRGLDPTPLDAPGPWRARRRRLVVAAVASAGLFVGTGGLAAAGVLPARVQNVVADVARPLGLDLPTSPSPPPARSDPGPGGGGDGTPTHGPSGRTGPAGSTGSEAPGSSLDGPGTTGQPPASAEVPGSQAPPGTSGSAPGQPGPGTPPSQPGAPGRSGEAPGQQCSPVRSDETPGPSCPPGRTDTTPGSPGGGSSGPPGSGSPGPPGSSDGGSPDQAGVPGVGGGPSSVPGPPGEDAAPPAPPGHQGQPGNSGDGPGLAHDGSQSELAGPPPTSSAEHPGDPAAIAPGPPITT